MSRSIREILTKPERSITLRLPFIGPEPGDDRTAAASAAGRQTMTRRSPSLAPIVLAACIAAVAGVAAIASADEGMWTLDHPPLAITWRPGGVT